MRSGSKPNELSYIEFEKHSTGRFSGILDVLYNGYPFPLDISTETSNSIKEEVTDPPNRHYNSSWGSFDDFSYKATSDVYVVFFPLDTATKEKHKVKN